jgi:predicted lipid carrier protein YhbT
MDRDVFEFPPMLGRIAAKLPSYPPSMAFATVLNLALGRIIRRDYLEPLHGKRIVIKVTDMGLRFHFTIDGNGFTSVRSDVMPDLAISATAQDFFLLASRKEDPDTLFFSRRLVVEGDTELGLVAKNTLDAMELPRLNPQTLLPRHFLGRLKAHIFH